MNPSPAQSWQQIPQVLLAIPQLLQQLQQLQYLQQQQLNQLQQLIQAVPQQLYQLQQQLQTQQLLGSAIPPTLGLSPQPLASFGHQPFAMQPGHVM